MQTLDISADDLVVALLTLAETEPVCILDSCGVGYLDSHQLIAGISPVNVTEVREADANAALAQIERFISDTHAAIFTLSYDLGRKLLGIGSVRESDEPDAFLAQFAAIIIHDYRDQSTRIVGDQKACDDIATRIPVARGFTESVPSPAVVGSNFTRDQYLATIEEIKGRIRSGDTYQTNLTQLLSTTVDDGNSPQRVFWRIRRDHPAPFSAFLKRPNSTVISASPERFIKIETEGGNPTGRGGAQANPRIIATSPIKGTRPRGRTSAEDQRLKKDLLSSTKDIAENTMIVDLLRNDLGRVCEFGSVEVTKLCDLEEHATFFHLVSTIKGQLRENAGFADILRALFPCGSITGAPKFSTMRIIDEIENAQRGLSMGAIGYYIPNEGFGGEETLDLSVAIRTMVIRDNRATFNVGGGITIDSDPKSEYDETLTKARALLDAIGGEFE